MTRVIVLIVLFIVVLSSTFLMAASPGKLVGEISDAASGEPLAGANVMLKGTAIGASTDLAGEFLITRIPAGNYEVLVTYIGYQSKTVPVTVLEDETVPVMVALDYAVLEGEIVVVTAQAEGQMKAINQQLSSNTITNIVSAERIQELPDANAAESVGRLPGISIKREGGEANKIVIRGLSPTYNTITVGGDKVPATDLDDRSVDLSMISSDILAGIEVTKALTPDQDADAFGGTVNFKLTDAPKGGFRYSTRYQQFYNAHRDEAGLYKGSLTLSNRFWNDKLGVLITGNIERTQRGSDQFEAGYDLIHELREGEELADIIRATDVSLDYVDEVRERKGFSLMMDYEFSQGKIKLNNFISRLDRHELIRMDRFSTDENNHSRRLRERIRQIDILTNSISGEHNLFMGRMDWRFSRSGSLTRHPFDSLFRFRENGAFNAAALLDARSPKEIMSTAYNDLDASFLYQGDFYTEKSQETDNSAQFNYQIPFTLIKEIAGFVKFGGKYINKSKIRDVGRLNVRLDVAQGPEFEYHHTRYNDPDFDYRWTTNGNGSIYNYIDPDFKVDSFLDGEFSDLNVFDVALDRDELHHFLTSYLKDSLYNVSSVANLDDYETNEKISAGYIMTEINFGRYIMFLPGIRYERTDLDMTGREGIVPTEYDEPELSRPYITDTTATNSYGRWFPMFHLRVRPLSWFDIRLAYTRSISRPQLNWMLPKRKIHGSEYLLELGQPDLNPQIATNYDVFLSFYGNNIGLLTLGGYYKDIDNLIFKREGHLILNAEAEGFPETYEGLTLDRPENSPFSTTVKGLEVEWQTQFHWLPSPFDGIVLNLNYSHFWSETHFPRTLVKRVPAPPPIFKRAVVVDTFRVGEMPDQVDDIANMAIGYDKGPFSARMSVLFQGRTLAIVGERPEYDGYTADLVRWDLSVKYRLTRHISMFYNLNNFTNRPDESYQKASRYLTRKEIYGWTTDLGIGFTL